MANKNNNLNSRDVKYTKLAYEQAKINLGSTGTNPSVGCIIVKNNSVISSAYTSFNGRPHAESNALQKKIDFTGSDIYISLEPCSHYGKTSPCINKIIKKKIKRVIFSISDIDPRSKKKAENKLKKKKITVKKNILKNFAKNFYQSYFLQWSSSLPFIDAKLAVSKDFYTINRKGKWITNLKSRKLGNFLRSRYDCLLTTSKNINDDNPQLDCRVEGLEKKSPTLIIIDRFLNIKKNSKIFKIKNRKIYIFSTTSNAIKEKFFKKKGIKIIKYSTNNDLDFDLKYIFSVIKKLGFNRVLVECGITFLDKILRFNLVNNFYLFMSSGNLKSNGYNRCNNLFIKKINIREKDKIKVNLMEDSLYKVKL